MLEPIIYYPFTECNYDLLTQKEDDIFATLKKRMFLIGNSEKMLGFTSKLSILNRSIKQICFTAAIDK